MEQKKNTNPHFDFRFSDVDLKRVYDKAINKHVDVMRFEGDKSKDFYLGMLAAIAIIDDFNCNHILGNNRHIREEFMSTLGTQCFIYAYKKI